MAEDILIYTSLYLQIGMNRFLNMLEKNIQKFRERYIYEILIVRSIMHNIYSFKFQYRIIKS